MSCGCDENNEAGGTIEECCSVNPRPARPIQPAQEGPYLLAELEPEIGINQYRPVITDAGKLLIYLEL